MSNLESVMFEIQVDKKILEQLLLDNENFKDCYEKLIKQNAIIKDLNENLDKLKRNNQELSNENLELKQQNQELEKFKILYQKYLDNNSIIVTDSELLKMKINKLEGEKSKLLNNFETQTIEFNRTLEEIKKLNNNKLIIQELIEKTTQLQDELTKKQYDLQLLTNKYNKIDSDNVDLERTNKELNKKILLLEQKINVQDLAQYEYNLLKLKLETVENEKKLLQNDYEREMKLLQRQQHKQTKLITTRTCIEDNIKLLKQWFENELIRQIDFNRKQPGDEKLLKQKIEILESDKKNLIEGFEQERQVFRRVLKKIK